MPLSSSLAGSGPDVLCATRPQSWGLGVFSASRGHSDLFLFLLCLLVLYPSQLLIQDVGLDSVGLATLVMKGALGETEVDPSIGEAFQWWVPGEGPLSPTAVTEIKKPSTRNPAVCLL